jgi:hypothetical protein
MDGELAPRMACCAENGNALRPTSGGAESIDGPCRRHLEPLAASRRESLDPGEPWMPGRRIFPIGRIPPGAAIPRNSAV